MLRLRNCALIFTVLAVLIGSSFLTSGLADSGANHQIRNLHFGVSGGNVNDETKRFCCSATLGALVTDGTQQYILSANHVLARTDQAAPGEGISQPGLVDTNCQAGTIVADFTVASPLGSNVDAAIAALRPGEMDSTGFIEDIGVPSSTTMAPAVGLAVVKSGRTTGFTSGNISSINTSVKVQYQRECGKGRKFLVLYTNQVVVVSNTFSAGGDSGSLILSDAGHNPVALLFAGSSNTTIANPIVDVLQHLNAVSGRNLGFVGGGVPTDLPQLLETETQPQLPGAGGQVRQLPQQASDRASAVLESHRPGLMSLPWVLGVGVGATAENDQEPSIVVFVDRGFPGRPEVAGKIDGVKVKVVHSDPFVAF